MVYLFLIYTWYGIENFFKWFPIFFLSSFIFLFFNFVKIHSVLREQWIRAKYERTEFIDGAPEPSYLTGTVRG